MVLVKRLCCFAFAFVLIVLCIPIAPASAADSAIGDLGNTVWRFAEDITPYWEGRLSVAIGGDVSFGFGEDVPLIFTDMIYDPALGVLYFELDDGTLVSAYTVGVGWRQDNMRTIHFTIATTSDEQLYLWVVKNAYLLYWEHERVYHTTYIIDGEEFTFAQIPGDTTSFKFRPFASGMLWVGNTMSRWYCPDGLTLTGFSTEPDNIPEYLINTFYPFTPSSQNYDVEIVLYPCYASTTFTSSIHVYNNDGSYLRYSFSRPGEAISPELTLVITDSGFDVYSGDTKLDSFVVDSESGQLVDWAGFSTRRNAVLASYAPGSRIQIGGEAHNEDLVLYTVFNAGVSEAPGADATEWLGTAVSGFLDFQIFPGLALSDLLVTIIAIGMLFTFLKIAI